MAAEDTGRKIKVAIVGGGCGALTTAFELTRPDRKGADGNSDPDTYEVTVYQMGWRLGGKGASGRNAGHANRTEEHGLHVWMGFYENAFRLIRECYAELPPHPERKSRFGSWEEAFFPDQWVGVADESNGEWRIWSSFFPATPGLPGDPLDLDNNPFTLRNYLSRTCDLLRALIHSTYFAGAKRPKTGSVAATDNEPITTAGDGSAAVSAQEVVDKITSVIRTGVLTGASALYDAMAVLQVVLDGRFSLPNGDYLVLQYATAIAKSLKAQSVLVFAGDPQLGPKLELIELVVTVVVGILRDQLLSDPSGLDAINDEDCRAWLRRHGASDRAADSSLVRALYNMAFADEKISESDQPGLAAGQALRGALRFFFTYRGSLFWKLRAGMGDTVFSPLYEVLKRRGVKFEFFHELTDMAVAKASDGTRRVTELHFHVQATLQQGWGEQRGSAANCSALEQSAVLHAEYYPLDRDGCWPSAPNFEQLADEARSSGTHFETPTKRKVEPKRLTAEAGHFDCVVLGIGVGAIEGACPSICRDDQRWRAMVDNVKTIPTQALQLWLKEGLESCSPVNVPITVSGFLGPFDTWSDMTHVIAEESWAAPADQPKGLVYFCGALPFSAGSAGRPSIDRAIEFLDDRLPRLWPQARDQQTLGFRWDLLATGAAPGVAPAAPRTYQDKRDLLRTQYFATNQNPSDRYVLTRPGTLQYRISPLDSTYENLTIAGDWTDCGFNEGCVEAAVMSGLLAAHSLCCSPALEDIIGFDHP